jgi:multidrug efflux pump subunit AcrA (membrane-fusion protein)
MRIGQHIIRRKTLVWYGALGVAAAAVLALGLESIYGTSSASSATARTVTVERGTVQSSVSASGNVSAATSDSVDFGTSGTLTAVDVTVGQQVTAGQVLGTLDPTDADATLASAQAALSAAQYTLTSAEKGGTAAQLQQDQATMASAQNALTSDEEQLTTDETDLTDAQNQLAADKALGCPAASSSASSSSGG